MRAPHIRINPLAAAAATFAAMVALCCGFTATVFLFPAGPLPPRDVTPAAGRSVSPAGVGETATPPRRIPAATSRSPGARRTPTSRAPALTRRPAPTRTSQAPEPRRFASCRQMRRVHPVGVPASHPDYRRALDRDRDGLACEPNR